MVVKNKNKDDNKSISSTVWTASALQSELVEHNDFFDMFVDIIPAKIYITSKQDGGGDETADQQWQNNKYHKQPSSSSTNAQSEGKRAHAKAEKRRRLDPASAETTSQKKKRIEADIQDGVNASSSAADAPRNEPVNGVKKKHQQQQQQKNGKDKTPIEEEENDAPPKENDSTEENNKTEGTSKYASRIEALRERLRAKLATMQQHPTSKDGSGSSKRAARKAQKNKRQLEAKLKKKQAAATTAYETKKNNANDYDPNGTTAMKTANEEIPLSWDYGRLTGLNQTTKSTDDVVAHGNYNQINKSLGNAHRPKNLKLLIQHAEQKQATLQELRQQATSKDSETTAEQAKQKLAAIQWSDALQEASGERIKNDDPKKLKLQLKKRVVKKAKSQKAWKSRLVQQNKSQQSRIEIRNHNLEQRKKGGAVGANLSKKKIIPEGETKTSMRLKETAAAAAGAGGDKKGRGGSRAGFEGKKQGFLTD